MAPDTADSSSNLHALGPQASHPFLSGTRVTLVGYEAVLTQLVQLLAFPDLLPLTFDPDHAARLRKIDALLADTVKQFSRRTMSALAVVRSVLVNASSSADELAHRLDCSGLNNADPKLASDVETMLHRMRSMSPTDSQIGRRDSDPGLQGPSENQTQRQSGSLARFEQVRHVLGQTCLVHFGSDPVSNPTLVLLDTWPGLLLDQVPGLRNQMRATELLVQMILNPRSLPLIPSWKALWYSWY